jgi:hypothetical protein
MEHYKNLDLNDIIYLCELDSVLKTEQWKDVLGYEGIYQVSDLGRIKSFKFKKQKILVQINTSKGYLDIGLHNNKMEKKKRLKIHRLVAIAFIPNPENKLEVNHKKGNKKDNRVISLEWNTPTENQIHAYKTGLRVSLKGKEINTCKLSEKEILEIRSINKNMSFVDIGLKYNISPENASMIIRRKTWKHL